MATSDQIVREIEALIRSQEDPKRRTKMKAVLTQTRSSKAGLESLLAEWKITFGGL